VFVDTGPAADSAALAAAKAAELVIVPSKTTIRDLKALGPTLKTISDVVPGKRLAVVLSMVPVRGAVVSEAIRYLDDAGIEVCPVRLHQRADFYNGLGAGNSSIEWEPTGKAAAEATALWKWACGQLGVPARASARKRQSGGARVHA
jgi:chromosome partitioning protein